MTFQTLTKDELVTISGGGSNLGSATGACAGAVLLALATGGVTLGHGALICIGAGIAEYFS